MTIASAMEAYVSKSEKMPSGSPEDASAAMMRRDVCCWWCAQLMRGVAGYRQVYVVE